MNSLKHLFVLVALMLGAVSSSPAADATSSIPPELRSANFSCNKSAIQAAVELKHAGWTYIMPTPKSRQAAWGNYDGRTTWWVGYWVNGRTGATSAAQPTKSPGGEWIDDGNSYRAWRRGGAPSPPSKIEWLCSCYGGIPPR